MAKFEFEPYDPTVEQEIVFDAAHYPDPASETETRKQLSCPLAQLKDFINSYLDENGKIAPGNIDASGVEVDDTLFTHLQGHDVQAVLAAADWLSLPVPDGLNGKTLKVVNHEWEAVDPDLPVVTSADNGKIASVVDGKWDKSTYIPSELPDVTVADNGKILKVFNGEWAVVESGPATVLLDDTLTFEPVPGKSDYYCEVDVEFT